jgi:hypothetical protein
VFGPKKNSAELKKKLIESLPLETVEPKPYDLELDRPFIMEKQ